MEKWYVTGDTHGNFNRLNWIRHVDGAKIIILGDAGMCVCDTEDEERNRKRLDNYLKRYNQMIYCVRGNHDKRPADMPKTFVMYDESVKGKVYVEAGLPRIHYFIDGEEYKINEKKVLVIGGAYSVDKEYRKQNGSWVPNEQLSLGEMIEIGIKTKGKHYDYVFTHTCPKSWQPTDLFLYGVDQSNVDSNMEEWLDMMTTNFTFDHWCWGHYHEDRDYGDGRRMFRFNMALLEEV